MKIAIFSDNFYPELSGISDSIISLARELAKFGHEINFYVPRYSAKNYQDLNLAAKELDLGEKIKIIRLFSFFSPFGGEQSRIVLPLCFDNIFKDFKPGLIHSQLFFGVGLEALAKSKLSGLPIIGTNHTAISEFVKHLPLKSGFLKKISLAYATWYYNRCDFVTAPSQSVFKEMSFYGFNRPNQVISNPIDAETFRPLENKLELKKQFNFSKNTVIHAGRLSPEKNIEIIIKAVAIAKREISDINLAIAGAGKSQAGLERLVKELGLDNEVKFFGAVSHEKIAQFYAASEIFAIASTSETQSLTLMQAFACGLPAVAVDARALPEYVNEKNGFVVKSGDENAMAEKFVLLLQHEKLRQELGRGAAEYVRQFSAADIAKKWEKLYSETIDDYGKKA